MQNVIRSILAIVFIIGTISVVRNSMEGNEKPLIPVELTSKSKDMQESESFTGEIHQSVFIPYWNIPPSPSEVDDFDSLIYFGISYDVTGKLIRDTGFMNIDSFIKNTSQDKERILTVRMLNTEDNLVILDDVSRQSLVINQTLDLVEQYGFDGVVLDLEMGVIPFDDAKDSITQFTLLFSDSAHDSEKTFSMTMYGDVFYRARPYDVEKLAHVVDEIYVMAYDFHKSRGEPGPNFPFDRQSLGDGGLTYDFQTMINDFIQIVPREKITILFGMYGYDWTLGAQGKPLKAAKAVALREIDSEGSIIDPLSKEKHILYTDDEGYKHELWFEDEESVNVKIEYLKNQGIGSVGYWVWGYF